MLSDMNVSDAGIALIKQFEGLRLSAYQDVAGVPTIGWGHTRGVRQGQTISKAQAETFLDEDVDIAENDLRILLKTTSFVPTQCQWDALVSFVFNLGIKAFAGSTAFERLVAGEVEGCAEALTWWNKARDPKTGQLIPQPGLVRRRKAEHDLFLNMQPDKPKPLVKTKTVIGGAIATAGGVASMAGEIKDLATQVQPYVGTGRYVMLLFIAMTIGGGALAIYGRWKLRREALERPEGQV